MLDDALGTLAEEYHAASRNSRGSMRSIETPAGSGEQCVAPTAIRPLRLLGGERVPLPLDVGAPRMALADALLGRRSGRRYGDGPIDVGRLATLLRCGAGTGHVDTPDGRSLRHAAPSAGGLGSASLYPVVMRVTGVDPGIYHYDGETHDLALVRRGRFARWLRERALYQRELSSAAVVVIIVSALAALAGRYGIRGYRLALLDAGHASQNLQLAATATGLHSCAVAGFIDTELDEALGLDGVAEASMLCIALGPPPTDSRTR